MKHTYIVAGMTCGGCKASVEEALKGLDNINEVVVDLNTAKVEIDISAPISITSLQKALSNKYTITEEHVHPEKTSELKQLYPLFLIFACLIISSALLNYNPWNLNGFMLDFMGLFYVVFSFFKLLDYKGFPNSFRMYDPLAKALPVYGWIYPFIEVGLGLMFLMRYKIAIALVITLIVLGITTVGVTKTLLDKKSIQCACLGTALKLPMTKATFIENTIMIIMAIFMLMEIYG
ncbi:heavy-metal-associated domain-containing protein [Seonamhaeicola marinus]|uniref:Heavy metal transporter n=1 Tax=Seonamhaeicola marinus TaxID=1912246 RepID=A0A5D0HU40_9FLAO|nr:heavy metal-associated domain-containing protein [Seonamhaeicola marinus]TYA74874.1 heavy metal transporter [Seonamhaeicola marinus]